MHVIVPQTLLFKVDATRALQKLESVARMDVSKELLGDDGLKSSHDRASATGRGYRFFVFCQC
eukprot:2533689-Amphidinium_carterae.1